LAWPPPAWRGREGEELERKEHAAVRRRVATGRSQAVARRKYPLFSTTKS
jgi:hypothetical protein